jgi:hypothetical protein
MQWENMTRIRENCTCFDLRKADPNTGRLPNFTRPTLYAEEDSTELVPYISQDTLPETSISS